MRRTSEHLCIRYFVPRLIGGHRFVRFQVTAFSISFQNLAAATADAKAKMGSE